MKKGSFLLSIFLLLGVGAAWAGPCPVQFPTSRGTGTVAGIVVAGGTQYYFKDALLDGFDCFEQLSSWFPSYITDSNAVAPTQEVVDMAYTVEGTATFSNVVVPTSGNYTLAIRYAFATGLFPGVEERPEGIMVNGNVITSDLNFPVTGDFNTFATATVLVPLNAGVNTVQMFNVATQSVSRLDSITVTPGGSSNCSVLPAAPGGLSVAEDSNGALKLEWNASAVATGCTAGYYNVYRGTTPGFTPSNGNQIATVVGTMSYEDTTAVCATPYYYVLQAADFAGLSLPSAEVNAEIRACPTTGSTQIDAGGGGVAPFLADIDFTGGGTLNHANNIDLSGVTAPAPMAVYQNGRTGNFTYAFGGFVPGSNHLVRMHFAETFFSTAGSRTFNVGINGVPVLSNYDIFVAAGKAKNKAVIEQSTQTADSTGSIVVTFTSVINSSLLSGIEVQ